MRKNYPLISYELNDKFQDLYYKLTYILGYDDQDGNSTYIGAFDIIEQKLRGVIYNAILQLDTSKENLILNINTNEPIPLYTEWGRLITINELRRM